MNPIDHERFFATTVHGLKVTKKAGPGHPAVDGDPQSTTWAGLTWSPWMPLATLQRRELPTTPGLYRFRCRERQGLLYVGEGADRKRRLGSLLRTRARGHPPSFYLEYEPGARPHRGHYAVPCIVEHEAQGCVVDVSWTVDTIEDTGERRDAEDRLHAAHVAAVGRQPGCWKGGRLGAHHVP